MPCGIVPDPKAMVELGVVGNVGVASKLATGK
jgi:hypothetical protein